MSMESALMIDKRVLQLVVKERVVSTSFNLLVVASHRHVEIVMMNSKLCFPMIFQAQLPVAD